MPVAFETFPSPPSETIKTENRNLAPRFSGSWIVGGLFALAAVLRLGGLGSESLWFDEGWTVRVTGLNAAAIVADAAADVHPPLYYFLMKGWVKLAGTGERALRLPSVLFGLAALWALYRLGREMFGERAARMALLLAGASAFHVRYSQEARSYSLLCMLALFSAWTFWRFARRPGAREGAWYLAATVPLIYVHNFALLVIAAQWLYLGLFWALERRARERSLVARWLGVQALLGAAYLPWLGVLASQVKMIRKGFWIPPVTLKQLFFSFIDYAGSRPLLWVFLGVGAAALLLGARTPSTASQAEGERRKAELDDTESNGNAERELRTRTSELPVIFLLLLVLVPNVVPYVVSKVLAPMYTTKSTIYCAPLFLLLGAACIDRLRWSIARWGVLVVVAVMSLGAVRAEQKLVRKEPWREAVRELEAEAQAGDLVLFNWGACLDNAYFYYSRRDDLEKVRFPDVAGWNWSIDADAMAELEPRLTGRARVWVVFCRGRDTQGLLIGRLRTTMRETFHKMYPGYDEFIEVYRFES